MSTNTSDIPQYSDPFPPDSSSKGDGLPSEAFIITGVIVAVLFICIIGFTIYHIKKTYEANKYRKATASYMVDLNDDEEETSVGDYQSPVTGAVFN